MTPQAIGSTMDSFILLAVPLFLLMSNILLHGGAGRDLFAAVQSWIGHWPGGVAVATILSCGLFSAISGSSVATAATIGTVAIPEMLQRGYPRPFVFGLLAAGGTLGILIPPSIPMIIFAFIAEESVTNLFLAGIGPGIFLIVLFSVFSAAYTRLSSNSIVAEKATKAERIGATRRALPSLALAVFIFVGIYRGVFTPTEAAAAGLAFSLLITIFWLKTMTWEKFRRAAMDSMVTSVAVLTIVAGAKIFGRAMTLHRIPQDLSSFIVTNLSSEPGLFVVLVCVSLLIMGLFLEALSMMLIMAPVLLPALAPLGLDPIWFGVFFVLMTECALITPPIGLNLYVIQSVAQAKMSEVAIGVWPFLVFILCLAGLMYWLPAIALYAPFGA